MNKFISFICQGQYFAIPIDSIEKILLYEEPAKIPDSSRYIKGFHSYEDALLLLIDMKERLFKEVTEINEDTKIIVVDWQGSRLGLVVEDVASVHTFAGKTVEEQYIENPNTEKKTNYLVETFKTDDGIILHIDVNKLFSKEGETELHELIEK